VTYLKSANRGRQIGVKKTSSMLATHWSLETAVLRHSKDRRHRDSRRSVSHKDKSIYHRESAN